MFTAVQAIVGKPKETVRTRWGRRRRMQSNGGQESDGTGVGRVQWHAQDVLKGNEAYHCGQNYCIPARFVLGNDLR